MTDCRHTGASGSTVEAVIDQKLNGCTETLCCIKVHLYFRNIIYVRFSHYDEDINA